MIKTWKDREGLVELVHRFHDMVKEEKNHTMRKYYWFHYNRLFKLWFKNTNLIFGDKDE
jgi:hypothetical protein